MAEIGTHGAVLESVGTRPLRANLRVLLLQIRAQTKAERHEIFCVRDCTGLEDEQMVPYNVVHKPALPWQQVRGVDAIVLGGSGDHSATRDYPFMGWLERLIQDAVADHTPVFGICWGHHFVARALGGEVVTDPVSEEVGTFDVELTAAGRDDVLFEGLPARFAANLVHHDSVSRLPDDFVELAWSSRCRNQAIRRVGEPVYGTQFHGEMTSSQLRHRLAMYQDEYLESEDQAQDVVEGLVPTEEARSLLRRFLELYT